jgi:hypothetical protein
MRFKGRLVSCSQFFMIYRPHVQYLCTRRFYSMASVPSIEIASQSKEQRRYAFGRATPFLFPVPQSVSASSPWPYVMSIDCLPNISVRAVLCLRTVRRFAMIIGSIFYFVRFIGKVHPAFSAAFFCLKSFTHSSAWAFGTTNILTTSSTTSTFPSLSTFNNVTFLPTLIKPPVSVSM